MIKNYGITIRYNSRSGTHNMYKEYRSVSLCDAVDQMCVAPAAPACSLRRSMSLSCCRRAQPPAAPPRPALPPPPPLLSRYSELAGRHRARFHAIQIVDTRIVPAGVRATKKYNPEVDGDEVPVAVKRTSIKQFLDGQIKFPLPHRIQRAPTKALRSTFNARRPTTFFH